MSVGETQKAIWEKLHLTISEDWISHLRGTTHQSSKKMLQKLQKDQYEFILTYMERIDEVKVLQQHFWEDYNQIKDPITRISCLKEARELTVLLTDLMEHLPILAGAKVFSNDIAEARDSEDTESEREETSQRVFS
jgi:hypothetical protein